MKQIYLLLLIIYFVSFVECVSLSKMLFGGHSGSVKVLAFTAINDTVMVTGADDGSVTLWDAETGTRIRTFSVSVPNRGYVDLSYDPTTDLIIVAYSSYYIASYKVFGVDPANGITKWTTNMPDTSDVVTSGGGWVLVGCSEVYLLNGTTGALVWTRKWIGGHTLVSLINAKWIIAIGSDSSTLHRFNLTSGTHINAVSIKSEIMAVVYLR